MGVRDKTVSRCPECDSEESWRGESRPVPGNVMACSRCDRRWVVPDDVAGSPPKDKVIPRRPQCRSANIRATGYMLRPVQGDTYRCVDYCETWTDESPPRDAANCPKCGGSRAVACYVGTGIRVTTCDCGAFCYPRKDGSPPRDGPAPPLVLCPDNPGDPPRGGASVLARYRTANDDFDGSIGVKLAEERERRARFREGMAQLDKITKEVEAEIAERQARRAYWTGARDRWAHVACWAFLACFVAFLAWVAMTPCPSPR